MMKNPTLYKIVIFCICIIITISLWNIDIFHKLIVIISFFLIYYFFQKKTSSIQVHCVLLCFIFLLLYEIISFFFSSYQANSILFTKDFFVIIVLGCISYSIFRKRREQFFFVLILTTIAGLLSLANIPFFFFKYYESSIYGFEDFSQFRNLYTPMGLLSNEWVTLMLCFLPFPIIGLFFLNTKPAGSFRYVGNCLFILVILLLIFNILISFSRAGILSLLFFSVLFFLGGKYYKILSSCRIVWLTCIITLCLFFFILKFGNTFKSTIIQTNTHLRSAKGRIKQWEEAIPIINTYPFWGVGSKNYALIGRQSRKMKKDAAFTGRVNNTYIQILIEKGLLGTFCGICFISFFFYFYLKGRKYSYINRSIDLVIITGILTLFFRELFFSSLLYNSGLLLLLFHLMIFNIHNNNQKVSLSKQQFIALLTLVLFGMCVFNIQTPKNSIQLADKALSYERSLKNIIKFSELQKSNIITVVVNESEIINAAITNYREAQHANPFDALFVHNMGWLFRMNNELDSALCYFSKSIEMEPDIAMYYISRGLILNHIDSTRSFSDYKQAVILSPDIIDSPFFDDLIKYSNINRLLNEVYDDLYHIDSTSENSIIKAKIGKILLARGNTEAAYRVLVDVSIIHPNLSRPWFYLGCIEHSNGNTKAMKDNLKKSLYLSSNDYLPLYKFANYYAEIGDSVNSNLYFELANKSWANKNSTHSERSLRIYYQNTVKDNIIPKGYLDYISPSFKINYDKN